MLEFIIIAQIKESITKFTRLNHFPSINRLDTKEGFFLLEILFMIHLTEAESRRAF